MQVTTRTASGSVILTHLSDSGQYFYGDSASGNLTLMLPIASTSIEKMFFIKKLDSTAYTATVTRSGSDLIDGATTYVLSAQYSWVMVESDGVSKWSIFSKTPPAAGSGAVSYTLVSKSAGFTANDATGTFYQITASSAIAITLPASPANGTTYKFIIISGSALATFTANGVETILNGSQSATTMTLAYKAGSVELIAVSGGWQVT